MLKVRGFTAINGTARRILLPFYPEYVRGQEKAVTVAAKSGQFTSDETEKGQFLRGNRKYLAEEGVVRKIFVSKKSSECTKSVQRLGSAGWEHE